MGNDAVVMSMIFHKKTVDVPNRTSFSGNKKAFKHLMKIIKNNLCVISFVQSNLEQRRDKI